MAKINYNIAQFNNHKIEFPSEILCYVEMSDRIIFLLNWFKMEFDKSGKGVMEATKDDKIYRNIFCYSKETGKQLWQIDYRDINGDVVDDIFVGMNVTINKGQKNQEYYYVSDLEDKEVIVPHFNLDKDILRAGSWQLSAQHQVDPRTGKTTFLYQGK